jgi:hypothetical protein
MSSGLLRLFGKIPGPVWAVVVSSLFGFFGWLGSTYQKNREEAKYPDISVSRSKALVGRWEGYGIQPITDNETMERLNIRKILIQKKPDNETFKEIKSCQNNPSEAKPVPYIDFPAHLQLKVEGKLISGNLELTPLFIDINTHDSADYQIKGRLEQNEYVRIDYVNTDLAKKEFGTILLQFTEDGRLCGKFVSYGPISRAIVHGDYIFRKKVESTRPSS